MTARIAAILGAGVIGAGWAARFAVMGWDVRVFDPSGDARARVETMVIRARASLPALYDVALPPEGAISHHGTLSEAVSGAIWIQESAPERLDLKRKLYQRVQDACDPGAVLASSSAGLAAQDLQGCATRPGQIIVARPADAAFLIPLVDLDFGPQSAPDVADRVAGVFADIGMAASDANDGDLLSAMAGAGDNGTDRARDDTLVAVLRALKARRHGAGQIIAAHEASIAPAPPDPDLSLAPVTLDRQVPVTWVDYNGHMNEARYLTAFSDACDRLLLWAGMDAHCIAQGHSVFTIETHIRHLDEVQIGDRIRVTTRVIEGGGKKLHIWHDLTVGDRLCATGEQLLLHMDLTTRRSALPRADVGSWFARAKAAQAGMPMPDGFARFVGQRT